MNLIAPAALGLLSLAGPLIVLYMLRSKRRVVEVSSTMLWDRLGAPVSSAVPWQRLRLTPLLLLQLLVLALFVLSLARPFFTELTLLGPHTVLVIDTSGSMADAGRLERAIATADKLADETGAANLVSVVEAGPQPRVATAFSQTPDAVKAALATLHPGGATGDLSGAIRLARGLATPDRPATLLIFSDGGLAPLAEEPVIGAVHIAFDETGADISIDAISAERSEAILRVLATVSNHTTTARVERFEVIVGGLPAGVFELELPASDDVSKTIPVEATAGDVVEIRRSGNADTNPLNDSAWLIVGEGPARTITLDGSPSPFLEALVRSLPDWEEGVDGDVRIIEGGPLGEIDRPSLVLATETLPVGMTLVELVGNVPVTYQRPGEPLLDEIDLSEVAVAEAQVIEAPTWLAIVRAADAPLILLGEVNGYRVAYFTFDITHSNLPLQVGFPILGARLLDWLAGAGGGAVSTGMAGDPIGLAPPAGSEVRISMPDDSIRRLDDTAATFNDTTLPGVYTVDYELEAGGVERALVAVRNFSPIEAGGIARRIETAPAPGAESEISSSVKEWAPWIVATVLLLLMVEWWVGHQRPGLRNDRGGRPT